MPRVRTPQVIKLSAHRAGINPRMPAPVLAAPPAPKHLAADERAAWDRFVATTLKMRVLTPDDWASLEHLACVYAEAQRLRAVLRKEGHTYSMTTGQGSVMIRPRPEVAMLRALGAELVSLYAHFGLTPADRANVSAAPNPEANPDDEF